MKKFVILCLLSAVIAVPGAKVSAVCTSPAGDANGNGSFNGIDVTFLVSYLKGGPPPGCTCVPFFPPIPIGCCADANGSCTVNGIDVIFMINYLKGLGPAPMMCPGC